MYKSDISQQSQEALHSIFQILEALPTFAPAAQRKQLETKLSWLLVERGTVTLSARDPYPQVWATLRTAQHHCDAMAAALATAGALPQLISAYSILSRLFGQLYHYRAAAWEVHLQLLEVTDRLLPRNPIMTDDNYEFCPPSRTEHAVA
ncbi:hypothetical protein H6771_02655 [Candidatus Peribacteria bacterium]|nr:hypothetical protein [Candidatus Peribacteria bacterium]